MHIEFCILSVASVEFCFCFFSKGNKGDKGDTGPVGPPGLPGAAGSGGSVSVGNKLWIQSTEVL